LTTAHGDIIRLLGLLTLDAVIGCDVPHFMRQHRRQLGRVIGKRQQSARDIEIAARQREGIHVGRVEDCDAIGLRRIAGHRCQIADDLRHHAFELGIGILATIGGQYLGVLLARDVRLAIRAPGIVDRDRVAGRLVIGVAASRHRRRDAARQEGGHKRERPRAQRGARGNWPGRDRFSA
jgi:hypothetical protein